MQGIVIWDLNLTQNNTLITRKLYFYCYLRLQHFEFSKNYFKPQDYYESKNMEFCSENFL